jgi:hypothetical protein
MDRSDLGGDRLQGRSLFPVDLFKEIDGKIMLSE